MKIVNRKKFIKTMLLMVTLILFIVFLLSNESYSNVEVKEKILYVSEGDTLWSIASNEKENNSYYEQKDIRDIVYEIRKTNDINNNSTLMVGQKLILNSL